MVEDPAKDYRMVPVILSPLDDAITGYPSQGPAIRSLARTHTQHSECIVFFLRLCLMNHQIRQVGP